MKKNINLMLIGIIDLLLIVITLCLFFIFDFDKSDVNYVGLGFVLFSEVLLFVQSCTLRINSLRSNSVFIISGSSYLSAVYFIATSILCLISGMFKNHVGSFVLLEIIVFAVICIIYLFVAIFSNRINDTERRIKQTRALIQTCESKIYALLLNEKYKQYAAQLNDIYENIKFSDKTAALSKDEKLLNNIIKLEEELNTNEKNSINELLTEIKALLAVRKTELAEANRGGY
ncbi:MAG: hypothetical protein GYA50_07710 [Eubacteriaceae bacterium]|nr:hypothetical protein [Eubacteriaceae bacterium]